MAATGFLPRAKLLAAALLFSTGGMAVKSCAFTAWQVAALRCGIAALAMLVMLPAARRWPSWRAVVVGSAYGSTLVFYVLANKATTAANAIFLQSTAPLYVLIAAPWLLGERARRRDLLLMAAMASGLVLLFSGRQDATATAPAPLQGNIFGALTGLCWALTVLGLRWLERASGQSGRGEGAGVAVVTGNVLVFIVCLPLALPVTAGRPSDWGWVLFLGVFQVALAYVFLTAAMAAVPALEASLLLLVEPVFNPLWAWWVHGEVPGSWAMAGGGLILVVTAVKSWLDLRRPPPR